MTSKFKDSISDSHYYELVNRQTSRKFNQESNGPLIGFLIQEGHFSGPLSPPSSPKKVRGADIAQCLRRGKSYHSLLDLLPSTSAVALYDIESLPPFKVQEVDNRIKIDLKEGVHNEMGSDRDRDNGLNVSESSLQQANKQPLTHLRLKNFVHNEFDLTAFGLQPNFIDSANKVNNRISVMLPNGPELAVLIIAMLSRGYCCAPINPTATSEEIYSELQSTQSRAIIILSGASISANNTAMQAAERAQIGIIALSAIESVTGLFRMALLRPVPLQDATLVQTEVQQGQVEDDSGLGPSPHPEIVLLLHTSGTSGNKKLVPYSLESLVVGVACIISSWRLDSQDVCLNMMPLFHIGGIVRNVLSPLLAGGAVVSCSGFDALLFWDILYRTDNLVTWYYAAPTMHHAILHECANRPTPRPVSSVRFIANAAGGLLPSLASALKTTFFNAVILTSYGMTECMPISSPPQNYALDPAGTSGVSVGPDLIIVDDALKIVPPGSGGKGNILIRGPPCFGGYLNNSAANDESFVEVEGMGKGWFNTGDVGSLDASGYLFISGRSKEIINRGGETISPLEVEEALQQHPHVKEALAFSAPHTHFQETVAAIVVIKPGKQRVDLPSLHRFLDTKLHRSKWPQLLVFSDALPKNAAGKLLRIKLGDRFSLDDLCADEQLAPLDRLYEAACPPIGTPLSAPIAARKVVLDLNILVDLLQRYSRGAAVRVVCVDLPAAPKAIVALVPDADSQLSAESKKIKAHDLKDHCVAALPGYLIPENIFLVDDQAPYQLDDQALVLQLIQDHETVRPRSKVERQLELIWRSQLRANSSSSAPISITSSFFDLGGDSLKAGQLVNAIRKELRVQLSVADLFIAPSIEKMAQKISKQKALGSVSPSPALFVRDRFSTPTVSPEIFPGYGALSADQNMVGIAGKINADSGAANTKRKKRPSQSEPSQRSLFSWDYAPPLSNTTTGCLFIQLLPLSVIYPIRRIVIWFLIAGPWVHLMKVGWGRFTALLAAMLIARVALGLLMPLVGILVKWLVIGRYRAGRYPLWGSMYLKWWIVEQTINIMGKGYFRDDVPIVGSYMVRLYYTLLGARIGKRAQIHRLANIGQADLLTLGDDVALDNCTVRPFALDEGHFVLLPIVIEDRCSVGVKSIVAPGSILKAGTCIGPQSSSHESEEDADPTFRNYCRPTFQPPPTSLVLLVGLPIMILITAVQFIPWFLILKLMVSDAKAGGWYKADIHSIYGAFLWWITPKRLLFFLLLRVVKRCVQPFIRLAAVILVKWTIIGRFRQMNEEEKQQPWQRFRYWLMSKLLPGGGLLGVAKLVGTHYEVISIIYRLLGAKIGKRVYWPGSGVEIVEFDLFEVGDDVVFGSRSVVLTSSTLVSKPVCLKAGCMVADRCVLLPGTRLEKGSVLGSGSLAAEDFVAEAGSVWVGSSGGRAVNVSPADYSYNVKETVTPFGRAFYEGKATYSVIPLWTIILYSTAWQAFCTCFRNCSTALSLMACKQLLWLDPFSYRSPLELFQLTLLAFIPLNVLMASFALAVDVLGKWIILGRRSPGIYPWDETLQEIRRGERHGTGLLDMIQGSQYLVWYFQALGCKIGSNVCLYPNGGNPMMTEPDLVIIGDFCCIDDASLIGHINTRGIFRLNPLVVGSGCVLKSNARLLSGATMQAHSLLMEHTLVMAGESVDLGSVWQGWPTRKQVSLVGYRAEIKALLDAVALQYTTELSSSYIAPEGEADGEVREIVRKSATLTERTALLSAGRERKVSYS